MKAKTSWVKDVDLKSYPPLKSNLKTEVAIIGGGLTGLLSAYVLAKEDKKVVVIEKDTLTEGATHVTTAFLTQIIDTNLSDLISIHGKSKTRGITNAHAKAIDFIEDIVKTEKIDCEFKRCSNYVYINEKNQFSDILNEFQAFKSLGIKSTLSDKAITGFKNFGYLEVLNQAKFHPLKFIAGLVKVLDKMKVKIYESTEAKSIDESPLAVVLKNGKKIKADCVIAATYEPFGQPLGLFFKKGMYDSYILEAEIPSGLIKEAIYEDTENPYHYFRIERGRKNDRIIIGGEDHRSDIPVPDEKNYAALEEYLQSILGNIKYKLVNRWDGPILEPSDGLALIGPYKNPGIFHAFGFSGNGMTYAAISALIFKELIHGRQSPEYKIFCTNRSLDPKSLFRKALDYGGEFIHGAAKNIVRNK